MLFQGLLCHEPLCLTVFLSWPAAERKGKVVLEIDYENIFPGPCWPNRRQAVINCKTKTKNLTWKTLSLGWQADYKHLTTMDAQPMTTPQRATNRHAIPR